jgi:predicted Fe-Mo cluster-binding NifX family protein
MWRNGQNSKIKNMRVAIPASDRTIDSLVDERFGRCSFFCFYNTETKQVDFQENSLKDGSGGVGLQAAEFLANNGVSKIYVLELGPEAKNVLDKLKIETRIIKNGQTVREIIELLNQ